MAPLMLIMLCSSKSAATSAINVFIVWSRSASAGRVGEKEEDEDEEGERMDGKLLGGRQPGSP